MTDHDDDDDAQLKSLRAVWLSMPDEEPPEAGLAQLMAAARVKAEEMAKPSLWERIAALLRRPPVLALATVLVLIGGAVFISQRKAQMESAPTVEAEQRAGEPAAGSAAPAEIVAQPIAPEPEKNFEGGSATAAPALAEPADQALSDGKTDSAPTAAPPRRTPPRVTRKPAAPTDERKATSGTTTRGRYDDSGADKDTSVRDSAGATKLSESAKEEQTISGDSFAQPAPVEAPAAESTTTAAPRGGASSGATQSRAPQYIAQAKSAAARGDCAAARMLMKRVAKEDAGAYRNALAGDASLKKCVVVAQ